MRRWMLMTALTALLAGGAGCKGCGDTASTNNQNSVPAGCTDADGDGFELGQDCEASTDCDDTNAAVHPDADEVCGDDTDNDCDGIVDEDCMGACDAGESRECSRDEGACTLGVQECVDGSWSTCSGQGPVSETCNGEDDDCDGEIDETGDELCDDGLACNGISRCEDGACTAVTTLDCSDLDGPCTQGMCSEKDGGCRSFPVPNGQACDDGNFCTEAGTCSAGVCETTPRDCSAVGDACNVGVCDETADACVAQPVSDGTTCDDAAFCTTGNACTAGVCAGSARDCSAAADQCNTGICDETADACVAMPVSNGTACDDALYCNVGEACQAGVCLGGAARDCSAVGGSCRTGACNEATDSCDGPPVADGTACDDSQFCTVGDVCTAGTCTGGPARDCSAQNGVCRIGTCNDTINQCVPAAAPNGAACNDGLFCTVGETCNAGACAGAPRNCSAVANACNTGACVEAMGACVAQPVSDGTNCPDALFCTVTEICAAGACTTQPRDCSGTADQCNTGVCNDTTDACVATPKANGTACSDGQFCTGADVCTFGACLAGPALDCSGAAMGDPCKTGVCNENTDMCAAQVTMPPPMTCCNVNIDADLDGYNECDDCNDTNGSVHPTAMEFCNGVDDDCDGLIDEDFDADGDGFATCGTDPTIRDCNDANPNVNPGRLEDCGPGNTGNGIDDDCDGYIDEGCNPCTMTDVDNDGSSECDGDCDDADPSRYPGAPELCDGKDNDCNVFTTPNCGVSDRCNHDLDNDYSDDPDLCRPDMICACQVNNSGNCTGNYFCTSFCNTSATGAQGDGCTSTQSCQYDLLRSSAVHGCGERSDPPGGGLAGATCSGDSDCRSLSCVKLNLAGPPDRRCLDYCGSDAYCTAANTRCRLVLGRDGQCYPNSYMGTAAVGTACTSNTTCDHGFCATDPGGSRYCTEPCCADSDCPGGFTCSLRGPGTDTTFVFPPPGGATCTTAANCGPEHGDVCLNGFCAWRLTETANMCIRDVAGQGTRVAGQSCTTNTNCASNFCELDLGVCVDVCCSDATCPTGLGCEFVRVETTANRATSARVCLNLSTDGIIRRR